MEEAQEEESEEAGAEAEAAAPSIVGDRHSKTFYPSACPQREAVKEKDRVLFSSIEEAAKAGYRPAKDCN
jgi:methylphosphotriester-DNA--protein-cysteine methyltransferase